MKRMECTLVYLRRADEVCLGEKIKKDSKIGYGKLNGAGGEIEPGETSEQGMIREAREEFFITPLVYYSAGKVEFLEFIKGELTTIIVDIYVCTAWESVPEPGEEPVYMGEPRASDEMIPSWYDINALPHNRMMKSDQYWLSYVLQGYVIDAFFEIDENGEIVRWKFAAPYNKQRKISIN